MKTFIVFLAIMLVNVSFLSFHSDAVRYSRLQTAMKAAAEECAAGGALYWDEEAFRQGRLVIEEKDAKEFAKAFSMECQERIAGSLDGSMNLQMKIFDDEKGYYRCEEYGITEGIPALWVSLSLQCKDLFRLPFLTITTVKRSTVYEWNDRYGNEATVVAQEGRGQLQ